MRRVALLCMGLVMGAASAAEAQLTMQMSNGWSFTFGGNVNAFLVYDKTSEARARKATPTSEFTSALRLRFSAASEPVRTASAVKGTTASAPRSTCVRYT
ncbi:MAG: hypothetical protein K0S19_848 [Geminicoccaceae bacterium]|nr:hypothetical protein [Geminicoccaceae bacterium]